MPSRCLPYVAIAILALALASPLVVGQTELPPPLSVSSTPTSRAVFDGEAATFTIKVNNSGPLPRSVTMGVVSALPLGWTWSFAPDTMNVSGSSSSDTTLALYIPNGSAPQRVVVTYEANDTTFGAWARSNVTVDVQARPPTSSDPATPAPPHISLSICCAVTGDAGETLTGTVTILHDDPMRSSLSVRLAVSAPAGWNAYLKPADQNRNNILRGQSVTLPVFVEVPALAQDTVANITILATVESTTYSARWTVTALASSPTPAETDPASESATVAQTPPTPVPSTPRASPPNFEILVQPIELEIESGGEATATVQLRNTGGSPLTIVLTAPPPLSWRPFEFEAKEVTLAPGETAQRTFTLHAPDGVPAGGVADITVQGAADGIVRRGQLKVHTVPALEPRDTSAAPASTIEAPVQTEGSGLPTLGPAALVAVGLAAAGSTALVLVNRPLREKLVWVAAGLYTRLARPDVLGHEDREKLYRLVETQPGIHFHALQRDLGWNTGTLTYHVRVLERHGFVVSRRDGLYRRFYLSGAAPRKEVFENQGPSGLRADVIEAVRNTPGISQSDLALGLGANKQTVNYHVKALERAGALRVEKRGRDTYLFPGGPTPEGPGVAPA